MTAIRLHPIQDRILLGIARGLTNQQIARELDVPFGTALEHTKRLFRRLGVASRAHAVAVGYETGLLRHGDVTTTTTTEPK